MSSTFIGGSESGWTFGTTERSFGGSRWVSGRVSRCCAVRTAPARPRSCGPSRAYVAHLFRARELLGYRLATSHNLTFTLDFMARIRTAIRAGTYADSLPELRLRAGRSGEFAGESA